MLTLFVFMGVVNGYVTGRMLRGFALTDWTGHTAKTALAFPSVVFGVVFALNLLIWGRRSAAAVPFGEYLFIEFLFISSVFVFRVSFYLEFLFIYVRAIVLTYSVFLFTGTLVALLLLWGAINTPLVYVGSYFGFKTTPPETPVRTNKIPRQVPPQPWYMSPWFSALVGGVLPFGAVFIELFFILTSMWLHQTYYIFGILFLVYVILVLTCAEITIVLCYFQLCGEDYRWWWRSFFTSGSSALYGEFIYFWLFLVIFGYFWLFTYGQLY